MDVASFGRTTLRAVAVLIVQSRIGACRLGNRTVDELLTAWSPRFVRATASNPVRVDDYIVHHTGHPSSLKIASGLHELKTVRLVRALLRTGMTFVDVGAHIGWYTLVAARAVGPTGRVFAFEAEPSNFELLRRNVVANGYQDRVTLTPEAVCDASRRVSIFQSHEDSAYSSMYATPGVSAECVVVQATSLDQFFRERGWPHVDVMKMDIEGAEPVALQGMVELAHRIPDLKLITEYHPMLLDASGRKPERMFDALEDLGFRRISIVSWQPIPVKCSADIARHSSQTDGSANLLCEK
jgi:FkbM family methyltransferase